MSVTHIVEAWMRTCQKKLFFPEKCSMILSCGAVVFPGSYKGENPKDQPFTISNDLVVVVSTFR